MHTFQRDMDHAVSMFWELNWQGRTDPGVHEKEGSAVLKGTGNEGGVYAGVEKRIFFRHIQVGNSLFARSAEGEKYS